MTISNRALEAINEDQRLSNGARQFLFMLFGHDTFESVEGVDMHAMRRLFRELEDAGYVLPGHDWKLQQGGHKMLFDRDQYPVMPMRLPKLPPPRQGFDALYVVGQQHSAVVKIGVTGNLRGRLKNLQTGSPMPLKVLWWHEGDYELEQKIHEEYDMYRLEGEWFDFGVEEPTILVQLAAEHFRPDLFPDEMAAYARMAREVIADCDARDAAIQEEVSQLLIQ